MLRYGPCGTPVQGSGPRRRKGPTRRQIGAPQALLDICVLHYDARDGSWSTIDKGGSANVLNRTFLTMYVAHGTDPVNASYACLLLPGASPRSCPRRAPSSRRPPAPR
ncbi:polysaccharide lyase family 8 super-sandwich domain-containing protein [Streptomyces alanosinicus]|uniref:Polysaccharide lyase family 8 central domain-containing protein n=1 Tax=Streptomyces alanosinicus TaxID=68171 RepID=A0A919D3Q8_9ACTN|nr:polysaccharide lyase family 8 super-sandwich domain-containing protein [Streptomyces alanosinicus]GHE06106.1 hypothetical protein GCM10010339_44820 [Streptomyces alanosinicus]